MIREALAAHDLEVDLRVFEDGEEALELVDGLESSADPCPALMLLDINLPRSSGFVVLEKLRSSKRCATIPVIVMTSSTASIDRERSSALGAADYFQKPSQYDAFMKIGEMVRQHLSF